MDGNLLLIIIKFFQSILTPIIGLVKSFFIVIVTFIRSIKKEKFIVFLTTNIPCFLIYVIFTIIVLPLTIIGCVNFYSYCCLYIKIIRNEATLEDKKKFSSDSIKFMVRGLLLSLTSAFMCYFISENYIILRENIGTVLDIFINNGGEAIKIFSPKLSKILLLGGLLNIWLILQYLSEKDDDIEELDDDISEEELDDAAFVGFLASLLCFVAWLFAFGYFLYYFASCILMLAIVL